MIIDMDTHIMPQNVYDYIEGPLADKKPVFEFDKDGRMTSWKFPGWHYVQGITPLNPPGSGSNYKGIFEIETRLEDYEKLGIKYQLLLPQYTAMMFNYVLDADLATAMAHSFNLTMLDLMKKYPGHLVGSALVALQDVPGAIRELEWAKANGFQSVALDKVFPVRAHQFSETLGSHRELWPFFKRVEELGLPIVLHNIQHGHRISNLMIFQRDGLEISAPPESYLSLVSLCTSGLLDEYPGLRFVFTEAGSAFIRPLIERFDASMEKAPVNYEDEDASAKFHRRVVPGRDRLSAGKRLTTSEEFDLKNKKHLIDYFKTNFLFTIETEEPELPDSIQYLGASQFLFATDYPHDDPGGRMKWKDVQLLQDNPRISESDKELIRNGNAERILGPVH